jgi:uncharacterized protein (DUF1330 family)
MMKRLFKGARLHKPRSTWEDGHDKMVGVSACCCVYRRCRDRRRSQSTAPSAGDERTCLYEIRSVTDPDGYKNQFLSLVGPKLEKHGNKFLARGGKTQSLIGDEAKNRIVLGEYPSMDAFTAFWNDAKGVSTGMRLIAVEGLGR